MPLSLVSESQAESHAESTCGATPVSKNETKKKENALQRKRCAAGELDRVEDVHIGLIRRVTVLGAVSGKGVSDGRKDVEKPK